MIDNTLLYDSLVELEVIDKPLLDEAVSEARDSGDSLEQILLDRDLVSDENLGMLVADVWKLPFVRLERVVLDKSVISLISEDMARSRKMIAFKNDEAGVHVAVENPKDLQSLTFLRKKLKKTLVLYYATDRDIRMALFAYRREPAQVFAEMINQSIAEASGKGEGDTGVINLVQTMMVYAYQSRASDVHVEPFEELVQIRFRVDGVLQDIVRIPKTLHEQVVTRIKIMSSLPTDEHASALDGKFVFEIQDVEKVDVRVSVVPSTNGERVVMRLLAGNMRQFALLDLGFSEEAVKQVRDAYSKPYGMVLSTGPTGSGKTTTMYALMKILNKRNVNIMTIEDPVEYQVRGINQIQVNPKTNLTFAAGLKSIVRQDPNIILVGEIRDEETAGIAVNAALTGHLVLSTLHTNDAATTIPRLLEMKIEPFLVASSVNMVIAQRLLRKVCPNCKVSKVESAEVLARELPKELLEEKLEKSKEGLRTYYGKGCPVCRYTGYSGRLGIFEVMQVTEAVREAIVAKSDADTIKKIAVKEGMKTMIENGLDKVKIGLTTVEELLRVIKA